jgi:hypothetical protein
MIMAARAVSVVPAVRPASPPVAGVNTVAGLLTRAGLMTLSTPRLMQAGLAGLGLALLLFCIVGAVVITDARRGLQTIGHDTAPSVVAAQAIRAHLSNLDAEAANAILTREQAQVQAWKDYAAEQALLSDYLVSAAQNITFGDAERKPILMISAGVQRYADLIGQARALMEMTDLKQSAVPDAALALIRRATGMLNSELLPAAGALNDANETVLDDTWTRRKSAFDAERISLIAAALPALILLVWLQYLLVRRTNRLVNPGLLAATLAMAGATLWAATGAGGSAAALTSAKQDAFDSVRAIWKSRAVAYSANADESFFLLDSANKPTYAMTFQKKIVDLTDRDFLAKATRQRYVEQRVTPFQNRRCVVDNHQIFAGLLGAELMNVTFEGECEAAANAYRTLASYLDVDAKIRDFDAAGQRDAAIALDVGVKPGESNYAFGAFDKALEKIIDINQSAFESSIELAESRLSPLPWIVGFGGALVWLLAFLGLRPRLNEYRA